MGAIDRTCQKLDVSKIGAFKNTLVDRTLILTQQSTSYKQKHVIQTEASYRLMLLYMMLA